MSGAESHTSDPWKAKSFFPMPLEAVPTEVVLPFPLFFRLGDQVVVFRAAGHALRRHSIPGMVASGMDTVFIREDHWPQFLKILEQAPQTPESETFPVDSTKERLNAIRNVLMALEQQLEREGQEAQKTIRKIQSYSDHLVDGLLRFPQLAGNLIRRYGDPALYFASHTLNVAIYSAMVAHKLQLPKAQVRLLTLSALLHNIGNTGVPAEVLFKPGSLDEAEWQKIFVHPYLGAKLLESFHMPKEAVLVAMQHHERMDGTGYPRRVEGGEIHLFARICSIADVYDALTNRGPYQERLLPATAVERMRHMLGKFDPQILNMVRSVK